MKNNIKLERANLNITQSELAEKVNVTKWTISQMELNNYAPSVILAMRIARVFNKPLESIFIFEEGDNG